MNNKKNGLIRKICIIAGIGLVTAAIVVLFAWQCTIHTAEKQTKEYVNAIRESIPEPQDTVSEERSDNTMPTLSIDETDFVGILEMPRHESALPVCTTWENISKYPCRFDGSIYDSTLQIGGTSQKGQYDFYRDISVGDPVIFTDMEGNSFSYEVTDLYYAKSADKTALKHKDSSLTLFIKNIYAFEYIIVYCNHK